MNLLRARVTTDNGWLEMELLDLDIVADGETEEEVLRQVEHALISEYVIALQDGETPFMRVFNKDCPPEVSRAWVDGDKQLRTLNLPQQVRIALAAVFRYSHTGEFSIQEERANAA